MFLIKIYKPIDPIKRFVIEKYTGDKIGETWGQSSLFDSIIVRVTEETGGLRVLGFNHCIEQYLDDRIGWKFLKFPLYILDLGDFINVMEGIVDKERFRYINADN